MKLANSNIDDLRRSSPAKASRRFLSLLIDSFILIIVSLVVFSGIFSITENTTAYKNKKEIVDKEIIYYEEFTNETHIVEYEENTRVSIEKTALKNLNRAICLSYEKFGNNQQPNFNIDVGSNVYQYGVSSLENDNISYFYTNYLPNNDSTGLILNMYGVNPIDYLYEVYRTSFGQDATFIFTFNKEISNVPILNTQVAYYIYHYMYIDSSDVIGETGSTYYNSYINSYSYMLENAESLLLNSEPYYSEHYVKYIDAYCAQARYTNISLIISIFISGLLVLLIPKYIFKNGRTIGYKVLGLGVITLDEEDNPCHITLLKTLFSCIGYMYIGLFIYMFKPFYGVLDAMFLPFIPFGNLSFGKLILIISIFAIIINIFMLFTHYRQNLLNMLFKDKVVDTHYIDEGDTDDKFEGRSY